jgi:hypothetical protein
MEVFLRNVTVTTQNDRDWENKKKWQEGSIILVLHQHKREEENDIA